MKAKIVLIGTVCILCGCASMQEDYEQANRENTHWSYQRFLSMYPQSEYTADVKQRIEDLFWSRTRASEQEGSEQAIRAYQGYLSQYPNGTYADEAKRKVVALQEASRKEKQKQEKLEIEFRAAKGIDGLESLLSKYAETQFAGEALALVETILIDQIEATGVGTRYCIPDLRPTAAGASGRVTISVKGEMVGVQLQTPKDSFPSGLVLPIGYQIWFQPGRPDYRLRQAESGSLLPMGHGSVHRFDGTVAFKPFQGGMTFLAKNDPDDIGYWFVSGGDANHRLTFYLTKEHGYVYLRGKGRVIPKGGDEVTLGY